MTWEYTGTGWINYLNNTDPIPDEQAQYEAVRDADITSTAWSGCPTRR